MNIITPPVSVVNYISVPDVKSKTTCGFLIFADICVGGLGMTD